MEQEYYTTHCRMGTWLVGVTLGYVLNALQGTTVKMSKVSVCIIVELFDSACF